MSIFKSVKLDTDNGSGNAFGHVRVSTPYTLFDSKQLVDNQPLFWDDQETSGSGTSSVHSTDRASTIIGVGATTAGTRVRQTFQRFNYQPGKSQLILLTGILSASGGGAGIVSRIGLFDTDNGIFLEDDAGTISLGKRSNVTGSPVDATVAQSSWNLDIMDGSGPSGSTLDLTKTNILVIDFEWLGVGRVRIGFDVDGVTHYVHQFLNANFLTAVYMSNPNLPLRYEISNSGAGVASTLEHICGSVMSEGGAQDKGIIRYASTAGAHVTTVSENSIYAIIGIRLKAANISTNIKLISKAVILLSATATVEWLLIWNPTSVDGTFTYVDETDSSVQIARGSGTTTVTGGYLLSGGYIATGSINNGDGDSYTELENALLLGSAIDGTLDEIVLAVRPIDGSSAVNIEGSLTWRELS